METIRKLGLLAFASRLKRLSDRLMQEVGQVYWDEQLDFQPRWFLVFYQLTEASPMTVTALAGAVGLTHPAVIQVAAELEQAGLIQSTRDPADRRKRCLELTARGKRAARSLRPIWAAVETATREVAASTGVDVLRAIDAMEAALDKRPMDVRVREQLRRSPGKPAPAPAPGLDDPHT